MKKIGVFICSLSFSAGSALATISIGGAGGDITGVTAGDGLSGGGTSGTVTISLDPDATNYIHNQIPLQSGTTFHTSSGTSVQFNSSTAVFTNAVSIGTSTADHELTVMGHVAFVHEAEANGSHGLELHTDLNGFGGSHALDILLDTGDINTGDDVSATLVSIDQTGASGGAIIGMAVVATEGSADVYAVEAAALVNPMIQLSGTFVDQDSFLVAGVDRLLESTSTSVNVQMFVANNATITIGNATKFEEIEFILAVGASGAGIKATYEFSTGVNTWTTFAPTDGTEDMRHTGIILFEDSDIPTWSTGTGSEFLIRITRTRNNLNVVPTESKVQIAAVVEYKWDKNGDVSISTLTANFSNISTMTILQMNWGNGVKRVTLSTTSTALTLDSRHHLVFMENTSDSTVTLPAASGNTGLEYKILKSSISVSTVTIDGNGSDPIISREGSNTTITLYIRGDYVTLVANGSSWIVTDYGLQAHVAKMSRDAAQTISDNTTTKIAFDNEVYDVGGIANSGEDVDRFDIRRAGKYKISAFWFTPNMDSGGDTVQVAITINGTDRELMRVFPHSANANTSPLVSDDFNLADGDFIEMNVFQNSLSSKNTETGAHTKPRMSVAEILP